MSTKDTNLSCIWNLNGKIFTNCMVFLTKIQTWPVIDAATHTVFICVGPFIYHLFLKILKFNCCRPFLASVQFYVDPFLNFFDNFGPFSCRSFQPIFRMYLLSVLLSIFKFSCVDHCLFEIGSLVNHFFSFCQSNFLSIFFWIFDTFMCRSFCAIFKFY
jgi:hypothetical protein